MNPKTQRLVRLRPTRLREADEALAAAEEHRGHARHFQAAKQRSRVRTRAKTSPPGPWMARPTQTCPPGGRTRAKTSPPGPWMARPTQTCPPGGRTRAKQARRGHGWPGPRRPVRLEGGPAQKQARRGHGWPDPRRPVRLEGGPAQKQARRGHGWPGGREMAGAGSEQPASFPRQTVVVRSCDAKCDAISSDCVELLARAVIIVAGMAIPEAAREAVLARVVADLTATGNRTSGAGRGGHHAAARPTSRYARQTRE
jgi:hypothetical protein